MDQEPYKSRTKVKVVALLDTLLTLIIMAQIVGCAVYPLWVDYSEEAVKAMEQKFIKQTAQKLTKKLVASGKFVTFSELEKQAKLQGVTYPPGVIQDGWLWFFTGLVATLGLTSLISILALLRSASTVKY